MSLECDFLIEIHLDELHGIVLYGRYTNWDADEVSLYELGLGHNDWE